MNGTEKEETQGCPSPQGFHTGGSVQRRRPGAPKGNPGVDIGDSGGMSRDGGGAAGDEQQDGGDVRGDDEGPGNTP